LRKRQPLREFVREIQGRSSAASSVVCRRARAHGGGYCAPCWQLWCSSVRRYRHRGQGQSFSCVAGTLAVRQWGKDTRAGRGSGDIGSPWLEESRATAMMRREAIVPAQSLAPQGRMRQSARGKCSLRACRCVPYAKHALARQRGLCAVQWRLEAARRRTYAGTGLF